MSGWTRPERMFGLKKPCVNCPFKVGQGEKFQLRRVRDIVSGTAFQCHKTVDYTDDDAGQSGERPLQCAGLMALLHREGKPNQMMQLAERMLGIDFGEIDASEVYGSIEECVEAHRRSL